MPPKINIDLCTGCGVCVEYCPSLVLKIKNDKCFIYNPKECTDCQACITACALDAINI